MFELTLILYLAAFTFLPLLITLLPKKFQTTAVFALVALCFLLFKLYDDTIKGEIRLDLFIIPPLLYVLYARLLWIRFSWSSLLIAAGLVFLNLYLQGHVSDFIK